PRHIHSSCKPRHERGCDGREAGRQCGVACGHRRSTGGLASVAPRAELCRSELPGASSGVGGECGHRPRQRQVSTPVEVGQKVMAGTPLGKVAQPSKLKDIAYGQPAVIDTRLAGGGSNGLIEGRVSRIDPSILNGTVTVDVALKGTLPPGARPDLSVDGTIQLAKLDDVVYVGRPVFGQQDATVQLFKLEPDGKYANKVKVQLGRSSVNTIEIKDGLKVGDQVILSDMSQYDNYDRIRLN